MNRKKPDFLFHCINASSSLRKFTRQAAPGKTSMRNEEIKNERTLGCLIQKKKQNLAKTEKAMDVGVFFFKHVTTRV